MSSTRSPIAMPMSSADLTHMVEESPDVLFQISMDGRWAYLNAAWTTLLGHDVQESLGKPVETFAAPEDAERLRQAIVNVVQGGLPPHDLRLRWRAASGRLLWMDMRLRRVSDRTGPARGIGFLRDIDQELADAETLADAQALHRAILHTAKAPIVVLSETGRVLSFNPACQHLSGYAEEEIQGRTIFDLLIPDEDRPGVEAALESALINGSSHHANRWRHRDGTIRHLVWRNAVLEMPTGRRVIAIGTDITRQLEAEAALRDSERRLREIADLLTEGVYVVDREGRVTFLNPAASALLGWNPEDAIGLISHDAWHHSHPDGDEHPVEDCVVSHCLTHGVVVRRHEDWFITRDGHWLPVAVSAAPIIRDGVVTGAVAAFHDISERLTAQAQVRESETRYRTLFDGSSDAIFAIGLTDEGRPLHILQANRTAAERLGYSVDDLRHMTVLDITDPESLQDLDDMIRDLHRSGRATFERVHLARDGTRIPVEINASLADYGGQHVQIAVARDITERKEAETQIRYLADFDQLTGLPNRSQFTRRCEQEMDRAARHGHKTALLFLDLDGFKAVNDTYGHAIGDDLLTVVADRLKRSLRSSDLPARQGGDEFVILLPEVDGVATAERVAEKLIEEINRPIDVDDLSLHVGVSIGIALGPRDGTTADDLQRHADAAMYAAKTAGRNQWAAFDASMEPTG